MLHLYLAGKKLPTAVAVEYVEAEEDGNPIIEGATFVSGLKALRRKRPV